MKNLRKWLLCVIAAVSLTVTACEGDAAANASVAADVAHAAGNILGSLAECQCGGRELWCREQQRTGK